MKYETSPFDPDGTELGKGIVNKPDKAVWKTREIHFDRKITCEKEIGLFLVDKAWTRRITYF